jgi:general stress protein 26
MDFETQRSDGMQLVAEMISDIRVCMLTTRDPSGNLVSRPMAAVHMDSSGSIWFFTNRNSTKTAQLDNVNVCFADLANADYASLSGAAALEFDREMIEELWSTAAEPWFPKGKDDPDLALLRFDTEIAELWDANDSRMVRVLALAAAAVTGKPNALLEGEHMVVRNTEH